ncbi:kinase-like domain-containing protein [Zopfochytrium polystomum]|nr:kinase-like domain-containing protein [Zopfochytrium polystomum]
MTEDEVASVEKVPGTDIFVASAHTTDDGSIIDWYQGERIGRGSFGNVYFGLNLKTWEPMAVKQMSVASRPSSPRHPRLLAIEKELKLLQMLDSPFTVKLLGFEAKPIQVNIFLEYCDGGSIASCLSLAGAFPPELTLKLLSQISLGLEYLHDKGIIHRDIKGANVLLTMEGHAKIGDFGISKHLQTNLPYNRASRMSRQGTAQWMAPEVLLHPTHGYSAKVDIWSLGCVAIEMATAQPPWSTEKNFAARLSANHAPPIPNSAAPAVAEFIRSCLELDPNLRPTASQLLLHDSLRAVDPWDVHFREWYEPAKARRQAAIAALGVDEDDEVDEDDDDDDSDG